MGFLKVNDPNGDRHVPEAVEGWRVTELIRGHGLSRLSCQIIWDGLEVTLAGGQEP